MPTPRYPVLFQVDTRVRLSELAAALGRKATLDDLPDAELDRLAHDGFDLVWLLGVWQTGEAARSISRSNGEWRKEYARVLPDFKEADVCGSCFAVHDYRVHEDFGGDEALARLRARHAEILARIRDRLGDSPEAEQVRQRAAALDPDTWVTSQEVASALEQYETRLHELREFVGTRRARSRRGGRRHRKSAEAETTEG